MALSKLLSSKKLSKSRPRAHSVVDMQTPKCARRGKKELASVGRKLITLRLVTTLQPTKDYKVPIIASFVCATGAADVTHPSGPTLFRSYDVAKNNEFNCCIWEACRATSAAPTFFKRIEIGNPGSKVEYLDGGLGCNNPIKEVVAEAARVFGENAQVACVVSIGTGKSGNMAYDKPGTFQNLLPTELIKVLKEMATDTGKAAEEMEQRYKNLSIYHRLDVDRGLQSVSLDEWKELGKVRLHTKNYMKMDLIDRRVDNIVEALIGSSRDVYEAGRLGS